MFEDTSKQVPDKKPTEITPPGHQIIEPEIFVMPELGAPVKAPPPRKKLPLPVLIGAGGGALLLVLVVLGYFILRPSEPPRRPVQEAPPPPPPEVTLSPPPIATTTPTAATTTPQVPLPKPPEVLAFGPDDDSDGLTNVEERLIYKSDPFRPDTDADDFLDGNEVFHLYSPIGPIPVRLLGSGLVDDYENSEFKYSFFYPKEWEVRQVATSSARELLVRAATSEMIILGASDNPANQPLFDWYSREVPDGDLGSLEPITTKGGFNALQTQNRLTTYVALPGKVLVISMNIGEKTQVEYRRTYEMMLNSLAVK
jgi:hypothetical protein